MWPFPQELPLSEGAVHACKLTYAGSVRGALGRKKAWGGTAFS